MMMMMKNMKVFINFANYLCQFQSKFHIYFLPKFNSYYTILYGNSMYEKSNIRIKTNLNFFHLKLKTKFLDFYKNAMTCEMRMN